MAEKNRDEQEKQDKPETGQGKNWLEWTVFTLSSLLVVATLGYLAFQALTLGSLPPQLKVTLGEPLVGGETTRVPVTVKNSGDTTAENVNIEVTAPNGDSGDFTMAFVPRGAEREGWVVFDKPYRKKQLKARVKGYEQS